MIGQRLADGRLLRRQGGRSFAVGSLGSRLPLGVALLNVAQQQLELLDLAIELLRRAPEARAAQNRELHAQLLDQQCFGVNLRRQRRREPPQFSGIFRQISGGARHAYGYHNTCAGAFEKARNLEETRAFRRFRRNGVKAAPHVHGPASQIDLHARRELEHQATPSADRTRRSASASTSASSDTLAPFGRLISIAPRLAPRRVCRAGFAATSEGGGAEAASTSSSS